MELRTVLCALVVLGTLGTSNAAPASGRCARECALVVNPKFNYAQGKVYSYNYQSETGLNIVGAVKEQPGYKVSANAEFHAVSSCELVLKLTNVQLSGSFAIAKAGEFKKALEQNTLLFSHTDGRVDDLCAETDDPPWVLNIKRAIVSTFQNSMDNRLESHVREVDVVGQCSTHYTIEGNDIVKTKDLLTCTNRVGQLSAIQADHYYSHSDIQSVPLLDSSYRCTHTISDSVTKQVNCHEIHRYRVHAKGDKAATTTTDVKLTYTKTGKSSIKIPPTWERTNLFFDHHDEHSAKADVQETNNVLKQLCQNYGTGEIGEDSSSQFTRLSYLLRRLSVEQLKTIYNSLSKVCPASTQKLKDTYLSGLVGAANENTVLALHELNIIGEVGIHRIHLWALSLAFMKNPTIKVVQLIADAHAAAIMPFDSTFELANSAIVHSYCRQHTDCQNEAAVQKVLNHFGSRLQGKCLTNNDEEEDKIISSLKVFGNIGRVGSFTPAIIECIKNPSVRVPIRLAAVESFRRVPADIDAGRQLLEILRDYSQDTEVRIATYLALVRHPVPILFESLKDILDHEIVNQVSSFIWTHLQNLQHSSSPLKREARELAEDLHLQKKFHNDIRKFSRNYDASFYTEKYNVGSDLEANVIFSPESYLPRSVSLNYTATLFGLAVNLFEVDVRAENFEYILEKYFGPTGKVTTSDRSELVEKYKKRWHEIAEGIENQAGGTEAHRHKRDLPYKPQKLREVHDKSPVRPSHEPHASVSLKVFGNELKHYNFHKLEDIYDKNDPHHLQDVFNRLAKHKELDVARNWLFIDGTYSVPTASGIPLRLDVNGSLSVGLKLVSHFDVRKFLLRPRGADIKSFIQPSANIELGATLILDAHVSQTGIKFQNKLYTAGAIDGTFQLKEGESLVAKLDFPTPSQKILKFRSKSYVIENDLETPATPVNPNRYEIQGCSTGRTGLQLCSELSLPKPLFDDSRPFATLGQTIKYDLILKKKDEGLQGFHLTALWKREKGPDNNVKNAELKVSLDSPGSSVSHEYTLDYQFNRVDKLLRFNLRTPRVKVGLNGNYVNDPDKKEAHFKLNINEREYALNGKTTIDDKGSVRIYDSVWEILPPNAAPTKITGRVTRTIGKKLEFDLKTEGASDRPISLKGFVQRDGELDPKNSFTASGDVALELPFIQAKVVGNVENSNEDTEHKHKINLNVDYTLKSDGVKQNFIVKVDQEVKLDREAHEFKFKRDFEFRSTKYSQCNVVGKILLEKTSQKYHSLLDAKWGGNFDDVNKKIFYEHTHKYTLGARGSYEGEGEITLKYPKRNIDWHINSKIDYERRKSLDLEVELKYAQDKTVKLSIEYKNQTARFENYEVEVKLNLPTREIVLRDKVEEKSPGEYQGTAYIQWQKGEFININSAYRDKSALDVKHHEFEATVTYKNQPNPIRKYKITYHREPTKFALSGRLERPDIAYTVDVAYNRPAPGTANLDINLKTPWIEGRVNSNRVPGDFQGNVDLKTYTGRKIKGSTSLKGDKVQTLTSDLKWDEGRDDSKRISVKAEIERPRRKAAKVKGTLDLPNLTVKGTVNYELPQTFLTGPHHVFTDLEYGDGKRFSVDANINIDRSQTGRRKSHGEIVFSSHYIQNWKLNYDTDFHNHPEERSFKAHVDVQCPKHGHYGFELDYLRGFKKFSSSVEVQYGEGKAARLGVGAFYDIGRGHGHGYDIGGKFELKTPFASVQDIAITMRDGFHHTPELGHFVTDHHVRWAPGKEVGLAIEFNRVYKQGESLEVSGRFEVDTPFEKYRHQKFDVDFNFDRNPTVGLHANADAEWGDNKKVETHLHYTRDGHRIDSSLQIDGRTYKEDLYVDATFTNEPAGPNTFESHTSIKNRKGEEATIHGVVTVTEAKSSVDVTITLPRVDVNVDIPATVTLKGWVSRDGNKRNSEVVGSWGQGKSIKLNGDWKYGDQGSFDGSIKVNSEALNIKNTVVSVEKKVEGPKRSYNLHLKYNEFEVEFDLNVADKADNTGITGDAAFILNGDNFIQGKFDVVDAPTKANHWGRLLRYSVEVEGGGIAYTYTVVLLSEKGINPTFKLCSLDGQHCVILEALVDLDRWDPKVGPIDNTVYAKFTVQDGPGNSRTAGVVGFTKRLRNDYEASLKLIIYEEQNKFVGVVYKKDVKDDPKKPDTTKTYQIILPSRTVEARSERKFNNQGYVYTLHLLANAVKEPNKELLITSDVKRTSDGASFTRNTKITVKHEKFAKDLIILSNIKARTGKIIFSQKVDFDLSKDSKKKFSVELEILDDPKYSNGHNYTASFAIRQPALKNLDYRVRGHIGRANEARSVGLELYWLTRANQPYVIAFLNNIDKIQKTVDGYLRTPLRTISWDGTYQKFDDGGLPYIRGSVDLLYDNKVVRRASLEYSRGPEYNFKYFIDPEDKTRLFRIHGGVTDDSTYRWTATRVKGSQLIQDVDIYHHLNNSHLLYNRYNWRPDLLPDLRDAIDARLDGATDVLTDIARNFYSKAVEEVGEKTAGIRDIVRSDLGPYFAFLKERLVAISNELKSEWQPLKLTKLRNVLNKIFGEILTTDDLVNRLEQRLENVHQIVNNIFIRVIDFITHLDELRDKLGPIIKNYFATLPERIQTWRTNFRARLPEAVDRIRNFLIRIRDFIDDIVENQYVSKALAKFREIWDRTFGRIREWISAVIDSIFGSDDGKAGLYERVKDKLYEYAEGDSQAAKVLKELLLAIKSIKDTVKEIVSDIKKTIEEYRAEAAKRWADFYDAADPDLKELIAEIKERRQKLLAKFEDDRSIKERVRAFVDKALGLAKQQIQLITSSAVFDPRNGRIEFYIPLILPTESIRTLRTEGFSFRRLIKKEKYDSRDFYRRLKRALTGGDILPPFEAHALLIGDQHFVTYDHRFFDFVGKCQYVLTTDLVDHNFTVIVNYADVKGKPERSSIVVISDTHNVEIKNDYKVLLDEQEVELPNQIENTHIHREQHAITVENNKGFTLVYDVAHNIVLVNISGYYFNRLGGLFGNYNNEPSDDFHTPDGQNITNPTLFANSWEVSNRCVAKDNFASQREAFFGSEGYLWCHKLFSSDWSPFRSCFPYAPADHFLKACLEEVVIRKDELSPADTACRVASAYIDTCEHHNIHLELPSKCLRCSLPDGRTYSNGNIQTLKGNEIPKSADVIFVVEQRDCNRRILLDSLDEVSKDLDKEFTANGLTNNHYGIVAFGGEGHQSHAHPHTARGQLFTDARSVVLALKNLGFTGTKPSDAFEAIDLACNYPFRAGVAKTIVLFLCSHCNEDSQSVDYSELQHHLLHHGISLHVLSSEGINIKAKPQVAQQIIGYDAETTFRAKDVSQKTLTGDSALRKQISSVDDVCFKLAQELDGSIFKSDQLSTKKGNLGKNVKTVFSRRVVASAKPSPCQQCDCVAGPDDVPTPFCSPCTTGKIRTVHDDHDVKPPKKRT